MSDNAYTTKNGWDVYKDRIPEIHALCDDYMTFLTSGKTERETVDNVITRLQEAGFSEDFSADKVFRICRGKALFAARKGKRPLSEGLHLISAHTDAPRLDLKQRPLLEQVGVGQAKTHYYGGIRKYQWLARPLAMHGVVVRQDGSILKLNIGEDAGDPVFTIADLLPHLAQKEVTKTVADAFEAEKLNIVVGHQPEPKPEGDEGKKPENPVKTRLLALLREKYAICEEDLMSAEIQMVPAGPAQSVGFDASMVGGYAQDDRACVYTALSAFLEADPQRPAVLILWDKEEIGSEGATGAQSRFLEYSLMDLAEHWEPQARFHQFITRCRAISADVHGAIDPDWQDLHEKNNSALFGHGPSCSKFTGSRGKYGANDAHPEYVGWLRGVLNARNIPWQMAELGKVDLGGGGTVALYMAAYGMDVIDMGPALLSMHSPFELASKVDIFATREAYRAFYEAI